MGKQASEQLPWLVVVRTGVHTQLLEQFRCGTRALLLVFRRVSRQSDYYRMYCPTRGLSSTMKEGSHCTDFGLPILVSVHRSTSPTGKDPDRPSSKIRNRPHHLDSSRPIVSSVLTLYFPAEHELLCFFLVFRREIHVCKHDEPRQHRHGASDRKQRSLTRHVPCKSFCSAGNIESRYYARMVVIDHQLL